jgi:hypothetical protein
MLAEARWSAVNWRRSTNGRLAAQFTATRVRAADGPPQRIGDKSAQHMPGEEVWLVGEHRPSGEQKYYLSNLPTDTDLKTLAATIKARWICEQAHQQLKEELGLDHFEGRSWTGLHRYVLMTLMASPSDCVPSLAPIMASETCGAVGNGTRWRGFSRPHGRGSACPRCRQDEKAERGRADVVAGSLLARRRAESQESCFRLFFRFFWICEFAHICRQ